MVEKTRTSMSLPEDVLDTVEEYQDRKHLDNRSEAMAKIVRENVGKEKGHQGQRWLYDFLSTSGSMLAVASVVGLLAWGSTAEVFVLALLTVLTNAAAIAEGRG